MKFRLLLVFLAFTPVTAFADTDCFEIAQSFRAEPSLNGIVAGAGRCMPDQMQLFRANQAAILRAVPITDAAQLNGTWLSDDVGLSLSGVLNSTQDTLSITVSPDGSSVFINQLIYQSSRSAWFLANDADNGYGAPVARGNLPISSRSPGKFFLFEDRLSYFDPHIGPYRATELFTLSQLNHFDFEFSFSRVGDTLVIESKTSDVLADALVTHFSTYSLVAQGAPDIAISLVSVLKISQLEYFDCFTHQLTEGEGGLLSAMAPYSLEDVKLAMDTAIEAGNDMRTSMDRETTKEERIALFRANADAEMSPVIQNLKAQLAAGNNLGCAAL